MTAHYYANRVAVTEMTTAGRGRQHRYHEFCVSNNRILLRYPRRKGRRDRSVAVRKLSAVLADKNPASLSVSAPLVVLSETT